MNSFIVFEDSSKSKFGGGQRVSYDLLKVLYKRKDHLSVIDFTLNSSFLLESKKLLDSILILKKYNSQKKSKNNSFTFSFIELIASIIYFPFNVCKIYKFINEIGFKRKHIIICTTKKTVIYGCVLRLFSSHFIVIFHVHNFLNANIFWKIIFKRLLNFTDDNWFVSQTVKTSFGAKCKGRILFNPVDLNFKKKNYFQSIKNNIINVGVVANLLGYKGIDYFVDSFDLLPASQKKNVIFHIFGDGPERDKLILLSKNNSNIIFHGFVSDINMYSKLDILVSTSIEEEAFSLVLFEATKYSIPVIATELMVHKEFFSDKSIIYIKPKSSREISSAILKLILNYNNLASILVHNAQFELISKFNVSFETSVCRALQIFSSD
jgi:glycosyltransferase involved in cell wall biosynthesis